MHIKRLLTLSTNRSFLYCMSHYLRRSTLLLNRVDRKPWDSEILSLIASSNLVELVFFPPSTQCVAFRSGKFHAKTLRSNPLDLGVFSWWHSFPRAYTQISTHIINMLFDENTQYCQHKQRGESKRTSHTYSENGSTARSHQYRLRTHFDGRRRRWTTAGNTALLLMCVVLPCAVLSLLTSCLPLAQI